MPRKLKPTDRWFELHNVEQGKSRWPVEYWEWLKANHDKCPFFIGHRIRVAPSTIALMTLDEVRAMDAETKPHKELPHAVPFPIYEYIWRFGTYHNNSISYMIGMAIMQAATHISVYGVDMAQSDPVTGQNGEYEHQRPSCEYMLGWARGAGIHVYVPGEADLLKCRRLYAFETHGNESERDQKDKAREKELTHRITERNKQVESMVREVCALSGALDQLRYDRRRDWY
jgi:hypothetical protein